MNISDLPKELIENFEKKFGALFIGAGLSIGAGLPSWPGLLNELIKLADKTDFIPEERINEYKKLEKDPSKYLFLAEELKYELGRRFNDYFEETFGSQNFEPTYNHELIAKTDLSLVITINYDDLIERAFTKVRMNYPNSFTYSEARLAANNFWKEKFFILKAHGDAKKDVESLILSQKDYRKVFYREPGYRSLIQAIFTTKSIVFLGVSFADPEFNQLLDYLHDSFHGGGPTHYLLIEESKMMNSMSRRFLEDFNIQTITFKNDNGNYEEITSFLEILQSAVPFTG